MSSSLRRTLVVLLATALAAALPAGVATGGENGDDVPARVTSLGRPGPEFPKPTTTGKQPKSLSTAKASVARSESAAEVTPPQLSGVCPSGQFVSRTYDVAGFEDGQIPNPEYTYGWTVGVPDDRVAPEGTHVAMTTSEVGVPTDNVINPVFALVDEGSLVVSLSYRGGFEQGESGLFINDGSAALAPSETWQTIYLDATSLNTFGLVDVYVDLVTGAKESTSHVEIDNVRAYACATVPVSGVRGDWTGDGRVDLLGTTVDGDLWLYPGRGNGSVQSGIRTGSGWQIYNWVGSPGDVTADRRSDLVARDSAGALWLYAGLGNATFSSRRQVGSGWGAMTALATPTDMDLDGFAELLARRSDGTLHLYSFNSTGGLKYRRQVGSGWNGMSWIIGMGDLNGDRRGDTVGVNRNNGCLYAYTTTTAVTLGRATQVGCGWNGMTYLTSPGDLNGDRLGDLLARATDGSLWFYQGRAGGGVRSGVKVGTGWQGMAAII